ncbi:hypothetical protein B0T14DRAFT_566562 [Immersiella caudata]|uniref:Uncharacterized protein n=1 Tax=Immersiella caudata TaxID=314043 RepID=A0AA39WQM9_9PEZI|nr:hypothetical protein B0T14DRAFT_566562 [Immersiella caudata]
MHDNRSHPLLQQVPLTVSPFVNLPTATTLPYTYKAMPSALPPSTTGIGVAPPDPDSATPPKPKYVISSSGHAAHPDDIIASCRALQAHIAKLQADAEAEIKALDERIKARELAEKRRVAPGWLDGEVRLLEPERKGGQGGGEEMVQGGGHGYGGFGNGSSRNGNGGDNTDGVSEMSAVPDEGEELDRAFGVMALGKS